MPKERAVHVHLLPELAPPGALAGGTAVVIDVLRATTTIVHALAAGCIDIRPCADLDEARRLADSMRAGRVLAGALEISRGGEHLRSLGFEDDIRAAAEVDKFHLVPELRRDPQRLEVGAVGIVKSRWQK